MKVVVQRVAQAAVLIDHKIQAEIQNGFLVLLGFTTMDSAADTDWMAKKIVNLRLFNDENGLMNLNLKAVNGQILLVSQFTLYAEYKKGNRTSFIQAARPEQAQILYQDFIRRVNGSMVTEIKTGGFGDDMKVHLINDAHVTLVIDSKNMQ